MSAIAAKALQDIDVLVEKVSSVTGLSTQAISAQLEEANVKAFRLNDVILISPDDFDSIIDSWADSIKAKLSLNGSAAVSVSAAPSPSATRKTKTKSTAKKTAAAKSTTKSTAKSTTKSSTKKKTTAKSPAKSTASKAAASSKSSGKGLVWPKGFEENVSHLYTHTLRRILPEDEAQRKPYLEAIANETAVGKKLADELVTAIVSRSTRTLAPEKVMSGLIAKCASMLS